MILPILPGDDADVATSRKSTRLQFAHSAALAVLYNKFPPNARHDARAGREAVS
jgi:hypothetical protein